VAEFVANKSLLTIAGLCEFGVIAEYSCPGRSTKLYGVNA
jgi:hypothetical protein